jgi:hypothetical protein
MQHRREGARTPFLGLALLLAACGGGGAGPEGAETDTDPSADGDGGTPGSTDAGESGDETGSEPEVPPDAVGPVGMRRLSRYELDNTVRDLVGDDTRPAQQLLPEDPRTPFDNEYAEQVVSQPLVESIEILARGVAERLVADPDRLAGVVGCTPSGATDEACMRSFVESFGRLALRRPLLPAEVDDFVALGMDYAAQTDAFETGVEVIVRALLQDAELVYRIELGTEVEGEPGLYRLTPYELASRMSYFLWGSTPDAALLDAAEAGQLDDAEGVRDMALAMLDDPRARAHVDRFHSLWLGYAELPHAQDLTNAMREETAALVERTIFEEPSSWLDLFTADETWLDTTLAEHYGLPAPAGGEGWVSYGSSGRMGILSHGSFLSVASNVADTSPTKRGKLVREQLMCQPIPPPPPDVMADNPPGEGTAECKVDRYAVHAEGACAGCHDQMDLVGFGLEAYDRTGRFREHDEGLPQCPIAGEGELIGVGTFEGPAGLAQLLVENELLEGCVAEQLYRYAMGRDVEEVDGPLVDDLVTEFVDAGYRFDELMLAVVTHEAFGYRREEVAP